MIKTTEIYENMREIETAHGKRNQFLKVVVEKSSGNMDRVKKVRLFGLDEWTNKETYSGYLRWCADEIDSIEMNRGG